MERYAGGEIIFDKPCDDIDTGALRRKDDVHAGGPRQLSEPRDLPFDFFAFLHHEVRQFVNNDHDERQFLQGGVFNGFKAFRQGSVRFLILVFADKSVVFRDVAHAERFKKLIALVHFIDSPKQRVARQIHIRHHGVHKVGQAVIHGKFHPFRVDQQHLHFMGLRLVEYAQNNGIEAHAFSRARRSRHEQMGHIVHFYADRRSENIFAEPQGQLGLRFRER